MVNDGTPAPSKGKKPKKRLALPRSESKKAAAEAQRMAALQRLIGTAEVPTGEN